MGFRDLFHSFHSDKENTPLDNANPYNEAKYNWDKERENFLDSLKVDVPAVDWSTQSDSASPLSDQSDGRERGDELTHTREDSLKMGTDEQNGEICTDTEASSSVEGNDTMDTDAMEDGDGLCL